MAHKTLINGTAYDIKGGRTLIDGTAYSIKGGKTLIDGTGRSINFLPIASDKVGDVVAFGGYNWTIVHNDGQYVYLALNGSFLNLPCYVSSDAGSTNTKYGYNEFYQYFLDAMNAGQNFLPADALAKVATRTYHSSFTMGQFDLTFTGKLWIPNFEDYCNFSFYGDPATRKYSSSSSPYNIKYSEDASKFWPWVGYGILVENLFSGIDFPSWDDYKGATGQSSAFFYPVFSLTYEDIDGDGYGNIFFYKRVYSSKKLDSSEVFEPDGADHRSYMKRFTWRPHIMIPL